MRRKLEPSEKRARRRESLRLRAYLSLGGQLIEEPLPVSGRAWVPRSRSGHPFSDRAVSQLVKRGSFVLYKQRFIVTKGAVFIRAEAA